MERMNYKGQAAITDALFFLLIVMSLVSFLFFFSSQYGRTVGEYSNSKFGSDYAVSALKTILYSSFARDGLPLTVDGKFGDECTPDSCSEEVDYLIAAVKEDYADDENINFFREELTDSIKKVMMPVRNSFDYLVYIKVNLSPYSYPYFFMSRKEFTSTASGAFITDVTAVQKDYYCNYNDLTAFNQNKINHFIVFVGAKGQAVSSLYLPVIGDTEFREGEIQLILWSPNDFNSENPLFVDLDCVLREDVLELEAAAAP